jgi:formamidopyrimidine-DNA glycosylase
MPELPEVETTVRGLRPHLVGRRIEAVHLRRPDLRWPIPKEIATLAGARIESLDRRAKYILMHTGMGTAIWHLGMSGTLRIVPTATPVRTHDHVDFGIEGGAVLRFHDPRRFGSLLAKLGPEPLSAAFSAPYLFQVARKRTQAIKHLLMDQQRVVGVGNIYAAEALFRARIRPSRPASKVTQVECEALVAAIQQILTHAIARGGTTLRDFLSADGAPGYFEQELFVYGREGEPCKVCSAKVRPANLGARQSLYCPTCQK